MHTRYPHNQRITRAPYWTHRDRIQKKVDELGNENFSARWEVLKKRNNPHEMTEFEARIDQIRRGKI